MPLSLSILNDKITDLTTRIEQLESSQRKLPKTTTYSYTSTYQSTTADPLLLAALREHLNSLPPKAYTQRELALPTSPALRDLKLQSLNKLMRKLPERVTLTRQRLYSSSSRKTQLYLVGTPNERAAQQTPEALQSRISKSSDDLPMYIGLADHLQKFRPNTPLRIKELKFPSKSHLKDPNYLTPPHLQEDITPVKLLRLSKLPENLIHLEITEDPDLPGSDFYRVVA